MCGWRVNHDLLFEQRSVGQEPLPLALAAYDDLVARVGGLVEAAVAED